MNIKKNLEFFREKLLYLKTIYQLISGKKLKSISNIIQYPNNLKKLKLFIIFFMPRILIKKFLSR